MTYYDARGDSIKASFLVEKIIVHLSFFGKTVKNEYENIQLSNYSRVKVYRENVYVE